MLRIDEKGCYEELKKEAKISLKNINSENTLRYLTSKRKLASLELKESIFIMTYFENITQLWKINKVGFDLINSFDPIKINKSICL